MAYHHGNLRAALLTAAVELVKEQGPDAVSVREVARRAGVSSGAPFRHFADKTALMTAVAEEGLSRLSAALEETVADAPDDPSARFRAMGVAYVRFAVRHPGHFRVMHRPEYHGSLRKSSGVWRERMRALIVAGQAAGTIRPGDPEAMMITAQALVYGVARLFVDGLFEQEGIGDERVAEIADTVTSQLGLGLALS